MTSAGSRLLARATRFCTFTAAMSALVPVWRKLRCCRTVVISWRSHIRHVFHPLICSSSGITTLFSTVSAWLRVGCRYPDCRRRNIRYCSIGNVISPEAQDNNYNWNDRYRIGRSINLLNMSSMFIFNLVIRRHVFWKTTVSTLLVWFRRRCVMKQFPRVQPDHRFESTGHNVWIFEVTTSTSIQYYELYFRLLKLNKVFSL